MTKGRIVRETAQVSCLVLKQLASAVRKSIPPGTASAILLVLGGRV